MSEEYRDKFEQVVSSYGQMESLLGADAYNVFIDDHRADQKYILAKADRTRAYGAAVRVIAFFGMLASIPVIVFLWKWALSY